MSDPDEKVSLAPLAPMKALRALLAVNPDDDPAAEDDTRNDETPTTKGRGSPAS